MDNPVDGGDNVGAVFAFLAAHPAVAAVLQGLVLGVIGGAIVYVTLQAYRALTENAEAVARWSNAPASRLDMAALVAAFTMWAIFDHGETGEQLERLRHDLTDLRYDLRELRAQPNKCMEAP